MANPFVNSAINPLQFFAPDVAADATQLARQQAMVDALRQRATAEDPTQVVSGIALKNSQLGRIASSLLADYKQKDIDQKQSEMARRYAEALGGAGGATTGTGGIIDPETLRQAAILDAVSPGAGKSLIQSRIDQNKPVDVVRTAQQLFPNDSAGQQQYLQAYARKQTEMTRTPGSYVVGMDGQMIETPMSAEAKRRLELQERSTAAQESRAQTAAREAQQAAGTGGGFAGKSMDAEAYNIRNRLTLAAMERPLTAEEQLLLQSAERHLSQPRIGGTIETGFYSIPPQPLPTLDAQPQSAGAPAPSAAARAVPTTAQLPEQPAAAPAAPVDATLPRVLTQPTKEPTQDQSKAAGFTSRMENAESIFKQLPGGTTTLQTEAMGSIPIVGDVLKRSAQTTAQQQYQQAAEDWVRAKLRKESGAVIGADEMRDEIRTYFPQPGDGPEVVRQKERARAIAAEALQKEAGRAYYKSSVTGATSNAASAGAGGTLTPEEQTEREMLLQKLEQMRNQR